MNLQLARIATADGAEIACKRRPAAGPPVIFVHGLAVNADLWDIPDIRGDGFVFRSLASLLHERGFDLWLMNLRGHGGPHMLSRPAAGQDDWCVDHFIHYDLPAVVRHVAGASGRRPFIIGNSMGAMTTAAWLTGATLRRSEAGGLRIEVDGAESDRRQALLAGAVLVEVPAALRWPAALFDEAGRVRWRQPLGRWLASGPQRNYAFELLARSRMIEALLMAAGRIPLGWVRPASARGRDSRVPLDLSGEGGGWLERLRRRALRFLSQRLKGATLAEPEMMASGLLPAADHLKAGVMRQFARSVRAGGFVSALGAPDCVYSDHYDRISLPTLVVMGGKDRIANSDVTRSIFFERSRSADKEFLVFDEIAHGEFEYSSAATSLVYPRIADWMAARRGLAAGAR